MQLIRFEVLKVTCLWENQYLRAESSRGCVVKETLSWNSLKELKVEVEYLFLRTKSNQSVEKFKLQQEFRIYIVEYMEKYIK